MMAVTAIALNLQFIFITDTPYEVDELHVISDATDDPRDMSSLIIRFGATRLPLLHKEVRGFPSPLRNGFGFIPGRFELALTPAIALYIVVVKRV